MSLVLAALALLQAAAAPAATAAGGGGKPDATPRAQQSVGVSVSTGARVLAPVRILREPATGAVAIDSKQVPAQSRRDDAGTLWIEFS